MKAKLVKDQDKLIIRLPDGMRDRIRSKAFDNDRSMNAEIVARLEESFARDAAREALDLVAGHDGSDDKLDAAFASAIGNAIRKVAKDYGLVVRTNKHPEGEPEDE